MTFTISFSNNRGPPRRSKIIYFIGASIPGSVTVPVKIPDTISINTYFALHRCLARLLTPDEDAVFLEFKRRDVKPGEEALVINLIAESCTMSYGRTRYAARSLFKKGYLYNLENEKEPDEIRMREILRNLLLHDPEIKELLKKGIVEEHK